MADKTCPRCGGKMVALDGEYALLSGRDVPAFGSKAEIMVTPRNVLRLRVEKCQDSECRMVQLFEANPGKNGA